MPILNTQVKGCGGVQPTGTITINNNGTYDVTNYAVTDVRVSSTPTEKYPLFSRVKDDTNTDIGVVGAHFTDANNQKYAAVVLLSPAAYFAPTKLSSANTTPDAGATTRYNDLSVFSTNITATQNTTALYNKFITLTNPTTVLTDVRTINYTIENTTYYGQLPNLLEMIDIIRNKQQIETEIGSSVLSYTSLYWTSTVHGGSSSGQFYLNGTTGYIQSSTTANTTLKSLIAILEIPIN